MNNDKDFEEFIKSLQKKIDIIEEKVYSKKVINEYKNPTNFGILKNADAYGEVKGSCGDTMKITLNLKNKKIIKGLFWTDGCGATIACGNMLMKIIKDKIIDEISSISKEELIKILDGLPKEHLHCAKLAIDTLKDAINDLKKNDIKRNNIVL